MLTAARPVNAFRSQCNALFGAVVSLVGHKPFTIPGYPERIGGSTVVAQDTR
jgi:hypothetical protein